MMKKFLSTLLVVFFATSLMAQQGLTCEDPIPVNQSFRGSVEAGSELWYTAWSYDLPLHVYFSPDVENSAWGPEVTIDFTCEEGVYDDPKLDSVVNQLSGFGLELPVEFLCDKVYRNGKVEWDLVIDQSYRERLTEVGITYNVQAFVKVYFPDGGEIRLTPDTSFQSCVKKGHYVQLSDTIDVSANDSAQVFVLPYSDWQNDSIQFTWIGDQSARVWVASGECDFTPSAMSVYHIAHYDIAAGAPHKLQAKEIQSFMETHKYGGIYFGKVLSRGAGQLVVERIPLGEVQGDAILLKHGESVALEANDNRVFCFPKTWKSTEFLANTQYLMAMHVSNTPEFEIGDANVISKYAFYNDNGNRELQLSNGDITALAASASDDYLYVRFECNRAAMLTPSLWKATTCGNKSIVIRSGETMLLPAQSSATLYRLRYEDWKGYDFTINWNSYSLLPTYIADDCEFMLSAAASQVVWSKNMTPGSSFTLKAADVDSWASRVDEDGFLYVRMNPTIQGRVTFTSAKPAETDPENPLPDPIYTEFSVSICHDEAYTWNDITYEKTGSYTQEFVATNGADSIVTLHLTVFPETPATTEEVTIDFGTTYEWHGTIYSEAGTDTITLQDENGCDYQATLILTILPEEQPETDGTILLNPTDELTINLDSAINVYHTEYDVWSAAKVQLNWYGDKPLHVFVAKDREFLVAIYHEDVVLYEKIEAIDPANGEPQVLVLDMSALRAYVNDGKLYVRFLTDADARLVIAPLTE